jgi:hypothetical protein
LGNFTHSFGDDLTVKGTGRLSIPSLRLGIVSTDWSVASTFNLKINLLIDHKEIKPKSIHQKEIVEGFADDYFYLGGIRFIYKVSHRLISRFNLPVQDEKRTLR